jgi:hypothetical protein
MADGEKMVRVKVLVAKREGFAGYWAAQRFFPEGETEAEVTEKQAEDMKKDPGPMSISVLGPASSSSGSTTTGTTATHEGIEQSPSPTGDLAAGTPSEDTTKHAEKVGAYKPHRK